MEIQVLDKYGLELYDNEIKAWVTKAIANSIARVGDDKIRAHNTNTDAHQDIRNSINNKATKDYVTENIAYHNQDINAHQDIRNLINNIEIDPKQYLTRNITDGSITLTIIED